MLCPNCSKEISDEATFCRHCGEKINDNTLQPEFELKDDPAVGETSNLKSGESRKGSKFHPILSTIGIIVILTLAIFIFTAVVKKPPEKILAAANKEIETIKSLHFTMKGSVVAEGEKAYVNASGDIRLPNKVNMVGKITLKGKTIDIEEIIVDNKLYLKIPDLGDDWQVMPTGMKGASGFQTDKALQPSDYFSYLKAIGNVDDLGNAIIDGKDCYHFAVDIDKEKLISLKTKFENNSQKNLIKKMITNSNISLEVWIGKNDNLPYQEKIQMEVTEPAEASIDFTVKYTDFNKEVNIEAPEITKTQNYDGGLQIGQ